MEMAQQSLDAMAAGAGVSVMAELAESIFLFSTFKLGQLSKYVLPKKSRELAIGPFPATPFDPFQIFLGLVLPAQVSVHTRSTKTLT